MVIPRERGLPTVDLKFDGISFIGPDGRIDASNVSPAQMNVIFTYLKHEYGVVNISYSEPFLVIFCALKMDIPNENERPTCVAGLIAIWCVAGQKFEQYIGASGRQGEIRIDQRMLKKLQKRKVPPDDFILYLANRVFIDCEALSFMWESLIVELPRVNARKFQARLRRLPHNIKDAPFTLRYYNGPLPNTMRRYDATEPPVAVAASVAPNDTDKARVKPFHPGSLITSLDMERRIHKCASVGIVVNRGPEKRLTSSWHSWTEYNSDFPRIFGWLDPQRRIVSRDSQGPANGKPGIAVGMVWVRYRGTNTALLDLENGIRFANVFPNLNAPARTLIASKDQELGDTYMLDSNHAGLRQAMGYGTRFVIARPVCEPVAPGTLNPMCLSHLAIISARHGAFATGSSRLACHPSVREGISGAVLLRSGDVTRSTQTPSQVMQRGEVAAQVQYVHGQYKYRASPEYYLVFADFFDGMIQEGWDIFQPQEQVLSGWMLDEVNREAEADQDTEMTEDAEE